MQSESEGMAELLYFVNSYVGYLSFNPYGTDILFCLQEI